MRYTIGRKLTPAKLHAAVPRRYRAALPALRDTSYTLLQFRSAREDVTVSSVVRSALSRLDVEQADRLVAVGGNFTLEALAILRERGAIILTLSDFAWTDEC